MYKENLLDALQTHHKSNVGCGADLLFVICLNGHARACTISPTHPPLFAMLTWQRAVSHSTGNSAPNLLSEDEKVDEDVGQLRVKVAEAERIARQYKQSSSQLAKENATQMTEITRLKCVAEPVTMIFLCALVIWVPFVSYCICSLANNFEILGPAYIFFIVL